MIQRQFYEELGILLYAIAKADGVVQQQEIAEIEKVIHLELTRHKHFKEHPEHRELILTKLSFENCLDKNSSMNDALKSFTDFMHTYGTKVDAALKEFAFTLINHIAHAYKGIDKSEEKLLTDAKDLLQIP